MGPLQRVVICRLRLRRIRQWASLLQRKPGQRLIALHWQGNPGHEHSLYSRGRSLPFEQLLPLGQLADVEFVSIQKGVGSEQFHTNSGLTFVAGQKSVSQSMDFKDTAAVLANCDLLISSDSAVAHLAGVNHGNPHLVGITLDPRMALGIRGKKELRDKGTWYDSVHLFPGNHAMEIGTP